MEPDLISSPTQETVCAELTRMEKNTKILDKDPCLYASLVGNYIYYLHYDDKDATTLYKIGIDGEGRKKVYSPYIFTCSTLGQYIYTSGTESDGAIYQLDTASDSLSKVYECNSFKPIVTSDDNVYYMDVDQNNALVHTNMKSGHPVTLTKDSLDLYNVYGSSIFFISAIPKTIRPLYDQK